jgi:hypothetical protein
VAEYKVDGIPRRSWRETFQIVGERQQWEHDSWMLFDNSGEKPSLIASEYLGETLIIKPELYKRLSSEYGQPGA